MKKIFLSILIVTISMFFINMEECIASNKHFACKLVMKNQKVFQTLALGCDWRELTNDLKLKQQQQPPFSLEVDNLYLNGDIISFQIQACDRDNDLEILIYNLDGVVLFNTRIVDPQSGNKYNIDIPSFKTNILFCTFINANNNIVKKIIN